MQVLQLLLLSHVSFLAGTHDIFDALDVSLVFLLFDAVLYFLFEFAVAGNSHLVLLTFQFPHLVSLTLAHRPVVVLVSREYLTGKR